MNEKTPENTSEELNIEKSIGSAVKMTEKVKENVWIKMKEKASKQRKELNEAKKSAGIIKGKQSKFATRSHDFLKLPISNRALHIVLNHKMTEIYKDGADIAPRIMLGIPGFGKECKKNVYERLVMVQDKIEEHRGKDPLNAPKWIILSTDTSIIMDRNLITRLEELKPTTYVAGAYGFQKINSSGKWYEPTAEEQEYLRGCYIQANMDNTNWDFIVGNKFKDSPRYQVLIVHGPFIAVRGELFMNINFADLARTTKDGFFHYMAEISMECCKRNFSAAQVKTIAAQYQNINDVKETVEFLDDHKQFVTRWKEYLPNAIPSLLNK